MGGDLGVRDVVGPRAVPVSGARDLGPGEQLLALAEADLDAFADALHDGPVQSLLVARYAADMAVRGGDPVLVRDAVQEAVVALRRVLWQLRPRGSQGLVTALERLSERLAEAGLTPLELDCDPEVDLSPEAAVTAYRLVQAVTGAVTSSHREPSAVRVSVRRAGGHVVIDVAGGPALPAEEPWVRRAAASGGDLTASAGRLRLRLPSREPPEHRSPDVPARELRSLDPPAPDLKVTS